MRDLFSASTTARLVYGCRDSGCCATIEGMLREPEAHHLREQAKTVADLSAVPESQRPDYFFDTYLEGARVKADRSQRLKKAPNKFLRIAEKAATRLNRMRDAFEQTTERIGMIQFAPEAVVPSGVSAQQTVVRRRP